MTRLIKSNSAVSEVLGTVILLSMVSVLFTVVALSVFNFLPTNATPSADLLCQVNGNKIILAHMGGDGLSLDTKIVFSTNLGSTTSIVVKDYLNTSEKTDGKWSVGEKIVYSNFSLLENQIRVMVVDPSSNSLILSAMVPLTSKISVTTLDATGITLNSANLLMDYDFSTQSGDVRFIYRSSSGGWTNTSWISQSGSGSYNIVISSLSKTTLYYFKGQLLYNSMIIEGEQKSFTTLCPMIDTSVNKINPYIISINPLTITAAGDSDLDNVTLYYRWSDDNWTVGKNWYDANWTYRKIINITGQAGAGPNYQVLLNIGETSGVSGANFNLGGHSTNFPSGKNIGGDLRFINKSDTTPLDFWVEDVSGIAPNRLAKVWVEVKDSLNSSTYIYCYYGNPSASNASNGTNTFNFFDNFDDNSIDASKWTTYQGTWSEKNGIISQTSAAGGDPEKCIAKSAPQSDYYAMRALVRPNSGTNGDERTGLSIKTSTVTGCGYNYLFHDFNSKTTDQFLDDQVAWGTSYGRSAWSFGTWYWFEICHDGTNVKGRIWNVGATPGAFNSWARSGRTGYFALNGGSFGGTVSFDDVFVRKCIATEPSYSSAGAEETHSVGSGKGHNWIIYTGDTNPDTDSPWYWSFDFPNGTGYYEFYSIGRDIGRCGRDIEPTPVSADARCRKT